MKQFLTIPLLFFIVVTSSLAQENISSDSLFIPKGAYLYPNLPEFEVYGKPAIAKDGEAVMALLQQFGRAWGNGDIEATLATYSEDIEWTNAFGVIVKGKDALRNYFTWLFSRDTNSSGGTSESTNSKFISLRYLGNNVAIYHGITLSSRGQSRSGKDQRRNHVTFVLEKKNGEWKIAHQMIMDARDWD